MTDTTLPARNTTRIIQGVILRCVDGHWSDRDGLTPPAELLAMGTTTALQCWQDGTPTDTIVERPGEPLPDVNELNAKIPEAEWEEGIDGKPRPPWVMQFVVYLIDPHTGETYTFINSTTGARIAHERLEDKFKWMRALRGCNVVSVVKLDSRPMQTKFGQKLRPEFTVIEWRELGSQNGDALEQKAVPQIEQDKPGSTEQLDRFATTKTEKKKKATVGKPVKPVTVGEEIDDGLPPWAA
jgi:hypothetical protein